jgi:hypothetical protein
MKQFDFAFIASGAPGGRILKAVRVEDRPRRVRPKLAKIESAGQRRRREKRELRAAIASHGVEHYRVQPSSEDDFGFRAALRHSPLVDCPSCHVIVRERLLVGGVCEACAYGGGEA